ncbi:MAG: hypothetical protein LBF60_10060 [Treponema sp.]|nr:hypothetical protein [Treponema sp.]
MSVEEKNEARDVFKAKVRTMVKFRFENPAITNAGRIVKVQCAAAGRIPPLVTDNMQTTSLHEICCQGCFFVVVLA